MNYYNENDPKTAAWLRQLIKDGLVADGIVDDRSITDVQPTDLRGFNQCHFFAGIGGWSYALRLSEWPDHEPVWTGSCPCQPFSIAGKGIAELDNRHLWPKLYRLISQCSPAIIFGEQVASKAGLQWLDGVFDNLENSDYACAALDLCAASVGAPHIRQRLYWVANAKASTWNGSKLWENKEPHNRIACGLANPDSEGSQRRVERGNSTHKWASWTPSMDVPCSDGKTRRTQPGLFPLANGVPNRVVKLRGYGNAIVPQLAARFIQAAVEAIA